MMVFVIFALDHADAAPRRASNYDAHKAFLADTGSFDVEIIMSGPLLGNDGETMIGSLFLVEAKDLSAVGQFNDADPFRRAGVWETVYIRRFRRRQG